MPEVFSVDDDDSSSDESSTCSEENYDSLDACLDAYHTHEYVQSQENKRRRVGTCDRDLRPMTFVRFNTSKGKPKPVTVKCLLDSGASGSLINKKFTKKLRHKTTSKTTWTTPAGDMTTSTTVKGLFTIPELQEKQLIEWPLHVVEDMGAYDMIIGRDVMSFLGIDIRFSDRVVTWNGSELPFKPLTASAGTDFHVEESMAVHTSTERIKQILDAKYEAADISDICRSQAHLSPDEQKELERLLDKYADLFDGTLGTWNLEPVELELKPDATPCHARPYPIPRVHQGTLKMEVDRLCQLGVLKKVNRSEWAAPSFIIPKKDGTVRFINDFRELNKRIRRKPFPIPNIQDMLLNLEGFQFATSLDLNMGYYHIELSPTSKQLCTLVFPFGKFEMQRLPMGLCNSPDIFQEKMSELFHGLEFV